MAEVSSHLTPGVARRVILGNCVPYGAHRHRCDVAAHLARLVREARARKLLLAAALVGALALGLARGVCGESVNERDDDLLHAHLGVQLCARREQEAKRA